MSAPADTRQILKGKAVAYSTKSLPPFPEAPPLGLFPRPPLNPKTGEERAGVWAYKLAVSDEIAQLAREVRARWHDHKQAGKRMPYVGQYDFADIAAYDVLDVEVVLPPAYRHYLYWQDADGKPLARWVYNNMPEEVAWEGGELHLRLGLFCYWETKQGVERLHRFTAAGYRLEDPARLR